ncbi:hypothetical protein L7F22_004982 [Adiantum nelumboides]|nr:hypothetical protein [Adiantum nelumboides]
MLFGSFGCHQKLVDNWGEHLQSVMWCSPQPHDIAQLEIAKKPKLSRTTRRRQNRELSQQQKGVEDKAQSIEQKEAIDIHPAPKHFKSYTTGDRKVVYTKAQRTPINGSSGVYDGPAIVKEIELAEPGEESKPMFIAQGLTKVEEAVLKELLKEFKDVFAWTYHDMKGVPPSVVQHTIPMISTAKPVQQRPYPMNPKYTKIVQEELEKLIECGFIYPIEHSKWVSPIVIVPKKNGKLRVCVDLKKVNAATRRDHYPLPYSKHVLERVAGKEAYSFLDGYSGYNQITIALEDQAKTAFITEFGVFAFRVMAFGLTNAPATFQQLINTAFKEYLRDFCEAFLDDLCIYSSWEEHLSCLKKQAGDRKLSYGPRFPIFAYGPFEKWGIDAIGPLSHTSTGKQYIPTATDYMTRWVKAASVARITVTDVSKFVLDYICSRFGTPLEILSDRGPSFRADLLDALLENLSIKHVHSTPYYPQCNGLVEKTNGVLCKTITKHVRDRPQDWDKYLTAALWAYRISFKVSTQFTPYHLVYGQETLLPIEVELGSLRVLARETTSSKEKLEQRILDLQ